MCTTKRYEFRKVQFTVHTVVNGLNSLGTNGWHAIAVVPIQRTGSWGEVVETGYDMLLEREVKEVPPPKKGLLDYFIRNRSSGQG